MDITRNGSFMYNTNKKRYTKTGQLISDNSDIVVLDKNSPVIQFESDYVKSKIVNLFGGKVIPGEITEQEAELVDTNTFVKLAYKLFFKATQDISFSEFKYFKNVTSTAEQMFAYTKLLKIEFPKNLNTFNSYSFFGVIFTDTTFIIPDSVIYLKESVFNKSNLFKIIGPNVTEILGPIASSCDVLENIEYPKLVKVKSKGAYNILSNCLKLKKIHFPNLEILPVIYDGGHKQTLNILGKNCPELISIDCPKLRECAIYTTSSKLQYITLGKVSKLYKLYCENADPKLSMTFDNYVDIIPTVFLQDSQLPDNANINYNTIRLPIILDATKQNTLLSNTKFSTVPVGININSPQTDSNYISIDMFTNNIKTIQHQKYPPVLGFNLLNINCNNKEFPIGIVQSPYINYLILTNVKQVNTAACIIMPKSNFVHIIPSLGIPTIIKDFAFSSVMTKNFTWSMDTTEVVRYQLSTDCIINGDNPFFGPRPVNYYQDVSNVGDDVNRLILASTGLIYNTVPGTYIQTRLVTVSSNYNYLEQIPDTVTEIAGGAFGYNQNTKILHIPANIKKIGYLAFAYSKIKEFHFDGDIEDIEFVRTGYDIYIYSNSKNGNYSPFYGMDNPKFYIKGREATKDEIQILLSDQNINVNEFISTKVPGTLYSSDYNVQVPLGVKAYTYKLENGQYVKSKTYNENQIIPKGEPVVLEGQPDTYKFYTVNYTSEEKDKNNILVGTESDIETNVSCYIFDNGTIEISSAPTLIKENTVYIKKDDE